MYAVIRTGGKQYRVQPGDVLRVEKLDAEVGKNVTFDDVLLVGEGADIKVGADAAKTSVSGVVVGEGRGKKVVVFKKRRRKNYRLTKGHRQDFTQVEITEVGGKTAAPKAKPAAKAAPKAEAAEKKEAAPKAKAAPKKAAAEKKEAAPKAEAKKPAAKKAAPKAEAAEKKEAAPKAKAAPKKAAAEKKEAAPKAEAKKPAAKKAAAKEDKE